MVKDKEINLNRLLSFCKKTQLTLLQEERSMHHDYIIVNLYNLVSTNPWVSIGQLIRAYQILRESSWVKDKLEIKLDDKNTFIARSICYL